MFRRIIEFFKKLFSRNKTLEESSITEAFFPGEQPIEKVEVKKDEILIHHGFIQRGRERPRPLITRVPKPGRQATQKPIGKFMKHGRQSRYYRKTVKAKIQPEED